jgi:hypothetical protein
MNALARFGTRAAIRPLPVDTTTGFPWVDGDILYADDLNNAFLPITGGHVTSKLQVGATGWLEAIIGATEIIGQTVSLSQIAGSGGVFGTRTSDGGAPGSQGAWAIGGFAINNNNTTAIQTAWSQYLEARRYAGAGTTQGVEICTVNQGDLKQNQPYYMGQTGSTLGLWLNSGRDDATTNNDNSLALGIIAGNALWDRGIMFGHDSVRSGVAIGMPPSYQIVWYLNDAGASQGVGVPGALIRSDASSVSGLAHPPALIFGNGSLSFDAGNNVEAAIFEVGLNIFQATQFNGDVTFHNGAVENLHLSTTGNISANGSLTVAGGAGVNTLSATRGLGVWAATPPSSRPAMTGAKGGNAALASVIALLVAYGFGTDGTT